MNLKIFQKMILNGHNTNKLSEQNLWEEDWDDDDGQDEVSNKLREELKTIKPIQ